jgi:replication initiation protein RepC
MEHVMSSPVQRHVRRTNPSYQDDHGAVTPIKTEDARWSLLDLVRRCRKPLGLRDRDVAVLRGLLSFVPQAADPSTLVVFASNRVLIERCDGIDERTLSHPSDGERIAGAKVESERKAISGNR